MKVKSERIKGIHLEHALFDVIKDIKLEDVLYKGILDSEKLKEEIKRRLNE